MHIAFLAPVPLSVRPSYRSSVTHRRVATAKLSLPSLSPILRRAADDTKLVLTHATKAASVLALIAALSLPPDASLAASGGGRVGGSSFRAPSVQRIAPSSGYRGGYSGGYSGGYGYGGFSPGIYLNPFIMPFGGFGLGGGFGTLFFFATAAAFLYNTVQQSAEEREVEKVIDPTTAIVLVKVGLLANAREVQVKLDTLARGVDTNSESGLRYVLGETVLALMRQPDFWTHGSINVRSEKLSRAQGIFDSMCMDERLKLDEETLTNVGGRVIESARASATTADLSKTPGEYIVVTMCLAGEGSVIKKLPKNIDGVNDMQRALRALAATSEVQGVEVIWAPQSLKDVLTEREMLADHPELKRL